MNKTPAVFAKSVELSQFATRLGKISFNLSIIFLVFCLCGILSFISTALIIIVGLLVIIITLGTIFVINPDFWDGFMSAVDISSNVSNFFLNNLYIFAGLSISLAVASLILLSRDKTEKHTGRITTSVIIIILSIIGIIINVAGGM